MITKDKITEIFCFADDFCKYFSSEVKKHQIPHQISEGRYTATNSDGFPMSKLSSF